VVPQIEGEDLVISAEAPTHRAPVVSGAEKPCKMIRGGPSPTTEKDKFIC
jgi:hypothetical protein